MKKLVWILLGICIILGLAGVAHIYYIKSYPQYQHEKKQKAEAKKFLEQLQKDVSTMQQRIKTQDNPFTYPENVSPCKIEGNDCWKVIQLAKSTKKTTPTQEEIDQYIETHFPLKEVTANGGKVVVKDAKTGKPLLRRHMPLGEEFEIRQKLTRYENLELQKMGLTIIDIGHYFDGGSTSYTFSNGVTVFKKWNAMAPNLGPGPITVTFPSLEVFVFDNGKMIKHSPAQDCIVNRTSCANLTQELNRFFIDKPNLEKYLCGRGNNKKECYNETTCDENNLCATSSRRSDQQLVGVCAENRQQNGETYTYTLDDGRTLLFNWEPDDPEHGFLTVTETDGTQKKFDPQGNRVN